MTHPLSAPAHPPPPLYFTKKRSQEGPRNDRKYRKNRKSNKDFFLLAKNTRDKYRKNRKNKKSNMNQDLETEEAKKGPEMSPNIAKIAKVTRIFLDM